MEKELLIEIKRYYAAAGNRYDIPDAALLLGGAWTGVVNFSRGKQFASVSNDLSSVVQLLDNYIGKQDAVLMPFTLAREAELTRLSGHSRTPYLFELGGRNLLVINPAYLRLMNPPPQGIYVYFS